MHAGETPERAIRGQATRAEVEALLEEGVGVLPMPVRAGRVQLTEAAAHSAARLNSDASITVMPIIVRAETRNGNNTCALGDRRQPHFEVLVVGHELRRRAIAAMAGDRHVANRADGDRPVVALGRDVALADVGQIDVEARVAVEHRNLAIARGRADQRTLGRDRDDDRADRVDDALLCRYRSAARDRACRRTAA